MLALLKIRNLALVDELVWEPGTGFLSVTGETGAGKSVIMGGISLALGERADKSCIRSGAKECTLEALFSLPHPEILNARLEEAGAPPCEQGELIIRRIITPTSTRQFINNSPVTLSLLRHVCSGLVDMHHPDSPRSLTSQERQLTLLDAFAEASSQVAEFERAYREWREASVARQALAESEAANERELDFLHHQIDEIEQAGFTEQEVQILEEQWQRARNAGKLRDAAAPIIQLLDGDEEAVLGRLRQAVKRARELERLDAACTTWLKPMEAAVETLDDVAANAEGYMDALCDNPSELTRLEERISLLDTLRRKYGNDWASINAHLETCRVRLNELDSRDELLAKLAEQEKEAHILMKKAAEAGPHGAEDVEFLFGPNPGEPLKALRLIASGGELARVMLALKSALAKQDDTPLLLFDEIDANVGGEIARAVGMKMRELGEQHQVIAITHFPQVAALAEHHYLISKILQKNRSVSHLEEVTGKARIAEIVRMLGSSGSAAEAHARDLLKWGN